MNASIFRRPLPLLSFLLAAVLGGVGFSACGSSKKKAAQAGGGNGDYASYPSDGHYNPYPAGSQNAAPRYQEYTEAPPPPPPPETKPKSKTKSSGGVASSSGASGGSSKTTAKKKSTTPSKTASTKSTRSSKSTGSGTVHVVKPGDSLWSIAKKYHTTVSKLKSANGLTSDVIRDGKKLKIP